MWPRSAIEEAKGGTLDQIRPEDIMVCQVKPWCCNRESEIFRTQEQCTRRRQGAEGAEGGVRIAPWRGMSSDAKSGCNVRLTLRPDSRLTFGALGAPDAQGAPGAKYYFCWWTPAARGHVVPGWAYAPPVPLSSSITRYSAPQATPSITTLRDRGSSPAGESSTPHYVHIWLNTPSRRNIATGVEVAEVIRVKAFILSYTLFVNQLPGPVTLMSQVHRAWLQALDHISNAGNMEPSEENIKIVSGRRCKGTLGVVLILKDTQ